MPSVGERPVRNASAEPGILRKRAQQIGSNFVAAIGVVVSLVTLILMLTSTGLRQWVKLHPYWIVGALIAAIVVIFVLLNVLRDMGAELRRLRRSEDSRHSDQDKRSGSAVLTRIPPEGALVTWLRTGFSPSLIPRQRFDALKEADQYLGSDLSRFGDPAVAARYRELKNRAGTLISTLDTWTSMEAGNVDRIIPVEWEDGSKYTQAVAEIQGAREGFIRAYDAFMLTCHERGIWAG